MISKMASKMHLAWDRRYDSNMVGYDIGEHGKQYFIFCGIWVWRLRAAREKGVTCRISFIAVYCNDTKATHLLLFQ